MKTKHVFLDNAATSNPKPEAVKQAMMDYLCNIGGASPAAVAIVLALKPAASYLKPGKPYVIF